MVSVNDGAAIERERTRRTADERRRDVLDAAVIEFATYGLHGASTEAIAARAGISQPYVLRLFGTKKQLFLDASNLVAADILAGWQRVTLPDGTAQERLDALGQAFFAMVRRRDALRLLLQGFASSEDADIRAQSQDWMARLHAYIRERTGATEEQLQTFFAQGMLLMVAASLGAEDVAATEPWARTFLLQPSR